MSPKGYTLVEILVALTVIGILFGAGFVGYRDFSRRQALAGAAKIIQGDMRKAQQNALSGIKPSDPKCNDPQTLIGYYFYVEPAGSGYNVQANCSGGQVQVGNDISLPEGITISVPTPNPILFQVLGLGTNISGSTTLTVTQALTGYSATITIGSGGDIK